MLDEDLIKILRKKTGTANKKIKYISQLFSSDKPNIA